MNDRFRKKLWHTNRKEFIEEFSILQTINSEGNFEHTYFERNPKSLELERLSTCQIKEIQSTGLKDKNGKLIYEGDIVKDDSDALHYVKWVYDSWQLFPCTQNNYTIGIVDDEIEVIGNIYENEELLYA